MYTYAHSHQNIYTQKQTQSYFRLPKTIKSQKTEAHIVQRQFSGFQTCSDIFTPGGMFVQWYWGFKETQAGSWVNTTEILFFFKGGPGCLSTSAVFSSACVCVSLLCAGQSQWVVYALVSFSSLPSLVLSLGANYLNGFHLCDQTTLTDWFPQRWSSRINLCFSIKGACLRRSFSSALQG